MDPVTAHYLFRPGAAAASAMRLAAAFDGADVLYAVKVNPDARIVTELAGLRRPRTTFGVEVASSAELDAVTDLGFDPVHVLATNPVRSPAAIDHALALGVRHFVADSPSELHRLACCATTAGVPRHHVQVLVRIAVDQYSAGHPLGEKFGTETADLADLAATCADTFGAVRGVAFHAGDQVTDPLGFARASERAAAALDLLAAGRWLSADPWVDLGGGWPGRYEPTIPTIEQCASAAIESLGPWWDRCDRRIVEPGRYIATWCYQLVATVNGTARRSSRRWAHLDAGVYNSVVDPALAPGIRLPFRTRPGDHQGPLVPWTLAGPTCDSADVLARDALLPADLGDGDTVLLVAAGASSLACASSFNGFAPVQVRGELHDGLVHDLARPVP